MRNRENHLQSRRDCVWDFDFFLTPTGSRDSPISGLQNLLWLKREIGHLSIF